MLIDLSLDCETTLPPERMAPSNRLDIPGIETCDYLMYPLPDQLADKLCAIMELQPGGYPSSRMKDLVDVVTYATKERFGLEQLRHAIVAECAKRGMELPERFAAPPTWRSRFAAFARKNGVRRDYVGFDEACALASEFFDPALASGNADTDAEWDPSTRAWSYPVNM